MGSATAASHQSGDAAAGGVPKCLIVDDDQFDRLHLRRIILQNDSMFEIAEAGSIGEARRLMEGREFDVLLLDNNLPDGLGVDFAAELKKDRRYAHIPTVMVTGDEMTMIDGSGFDGVHKDKITANALIESVTRQIAGYGERADIEEAEDDAGDVAQELVAEIVRSIAPPLDRIQRIVRTAEDQLAAASPEETAVYLSQIDDMVNSLREHLELLASKPPRH